MEYKRIAVIGCGGIGSALLDPLCRYINYSDMKDKPTILLIDGDNYEQKNSARQAFTEVGGNKATTKRIELEEIFTSMSFVDVNVYLTSENVDSILEGCDIVFTGVDNHTSRKLISEWASRQPNVVVISGGNDYTDGNVQQYIRRNAKDVTPSLTDYHDEIQNPTDKNPADLSCQELAAAGAPQLLFANLTAANIMLMAFYNIIHDQISGSESYFDIKTMQVRTLERRPLSAVETK